jgi:phosphate-selective porin
LSAAFGAPSFVRAQATWGGYLQTRFSSDFRSSTGFSVRRAKLYTTGVAPFDTNLTARMQGIFRWQNAGTFTLQDVYAEYRLTNVSFRAGQFVPEFSLQRLQPDAVIPVVERALVVDALVPSAETYARDIGAEIATRPLSNVQLTFGAFNGNGGNQSGNNDRQLLYVARSVFQTFLADSIQIHFGASFSYRNKSAMIFKKIFGTTVPFSGKDTRWGSEFLLSSSVWSFQVEYIEAHLAAKMASGYYVLGAVLLDGTNELAGLVEQLQDLDPKSSNSPWYGAGWNHYFSANNFKTQFAVRVQPSDARDQYAATLQLQLYIH